MGNKGTKRRKQLAEKKARRAARYVPSHNGVGSSEFAKKERQQRRGNFSRRSPFVPNREEHETP